MSRSANSSRRQQAGRALRALERRATTRIGDARAALDRLRTPPRPALPSPVAAPPPAPAEVSDIEVRDLRAELARELDRLADADISASRGNGRVAGEAPPADGRA